MNSTRAYRSLDSILPSLRNHRKRSSMPNLDPKNVKLSSAYETLMKELDKYEKSFVPAPETMEFVKKFLQEKYNKNPMKNHSFDDYELNIFRLAVVVPPEYIINNPQSQEEDHIFEVGWFHRIDETLAKQSMELFGQKFNEFNNDHMYKITLTLCDIPNMYNLMYFADISEVSDNKKKYRVVVSFKI